MWMKAFIKSILMIFLLFFASCPLFSQAICSKLFEYLEKKELNPQAQLLTAGSSNKLPYNIIVNFTPEDIQIEDNLVILLDLEQAYTYREAVSPIFDELKTQKYNSSVVFCYGSRLELPRQNIIYGSQVFARSLNSDGSNHVYIFNLAAEKNAIIPGSNKNHSPSWMVKDMFDAFSSAKISEGLPVCYISQVAEYTFSTDRTMLSFLEADIPCISADIKDAEKAGLVIKSCINSYQKSSSKPDDSHTFMFNFFGKRIWFTEFSIINAIIIIVILSLLFVFCLGFINKNIRREFWNEISSIWYVLPIIYIISYCGFFLGKGLYILFTHRQPQNYTVFGFMILQISIATALVSGFFMLNLSLQKKYTTRSLDFLLVINAFINLLIFTLIDISLFPIFLLIFIVAVISLIFRRNWIHIILFVFLIIPFIPYVNALFTISDKASLHNLLIKSNTLPFLISLILLPVYLMWLRILNSMKKRYTKKRIYATVITAAYIFIILSLIILNRFFYSNKKEAAKNIQIFSIEEEADNSFDFSLSYKDRFVFEDTIRQISINSKSLPVYCSVKVISSNPILYSENDYMLTSTQQAEFLLPLYPSEQLEFNYGTRESSQTIYVEEIFYSPGNGKYYSLTKSLFTKDMQ